MVFLCALLINPFGIKVHAAENYNYASGPEGYTLNIKGPDGSNHQIKGSRIKLQYYTDDSMNSAAQKRFRRASQYTFTDSSGVTIGISFDEKLLREEIEKLSFMNGDDIIQSKDPGFAYTEEGYIIIDEVYGNKINNNALYRNAVNAIYNLETLVDLQAVDCYDKPQYTRESQKIVEVKEMLNRYVSSKITYSFGQDQVIVDGSLINQWLTVDDNLDIVFGEEKIKNYIDGLKKYNPALKTRKFVTSSGKSISISSGGYTWIINAVREVEDLIQAIKAGQAITKEPVYAPRDYVEINLAEQHLWFYKNGSLVADGDVVTGSLRGGHKTPEGVYRLRTKKRNAVLVGPDYRAPVSFWMPFNGGIGIHDATWRRKFGGDIYKTDGSHGCINCPYTLAKTIYEKIDVGTLVICYN